MTDPIDEAPAAVWYVRPPSGGQYGPAAGPTMRSWLQEGRVTGNSLVWRDGWPDWRSAAATFPSLATAQPAWGAAGVAPQAAPQAGAVPHAAAPGGWQQPAAVPMAAAHAGMGPVGVPLAAQAGVPMGHVMSALETPLGGYDSPADDEFTSRRKRRSAKKGPDITTYVAVALVVMTVVLVVVLTVVLIKQSKTPEETPPGSTKSAPAEGAAEEEADDDTMAPPAEDAEPKPKAKNRKKAKPKTDAEASNGKRHFPPCDRAVAVVPARHADEIDAKICSIRAYTSFPLANFPLSTESYL
jgi:hypothetical protein